MTRTQSGAAATQTTRSALLLASSLLGAAAAFVAFALVLQTPVVSTARLLAMLVLIPVISLAHYWVAARWFAGKLEAPETPRLIGLAVLLVAIFLPLLYQPPGYPLSPLLRPWSDLAVQFEAPAGLAPLTLSKEGVRLVMGREALNAQAFELVGPWQASASQFTLAAGETGSLQWTGTLPETTALSIQPTSTAANLTVYWDGTRTTLQLQGAQQAPILITKKESLPWGYNMAFGAGCFVLAAWLLAWAGLLFGQRLGRQQLEALKLPAWVVLLLAILLAVLTVKLQVDSLSGGVQYFTTTQLVRHTAVLQGQAPDPWQYRLLSEYLAEGMLRLFQALGLPAAINAAFILLRLLQNVGIFLVAYAVYKRIAGASALGLLGVLILAASMSRAFYDNDLSFNTYFDLLFYLLCILLLISRNYRGVVILTVFAALNRETSGLIPFVMAGAIYGDNTRPGLRKYVPVLLSLAIFVGIFMGLRFLFPARPLYIPYRHAPGIPLLLYNITRTFTWQQLLGTLGLVPFIGLAFWASWPPAWQRLLLIVCPIWFVIHSFASIMAETRLFLVPQAIVFIPGALFALVAWQNAKGKHAIPSLPFERGVA